MIGDRDVLVAELARALGHLADAALAVAGRRVHVEVAAQVFTGDQTRQAAPIGGRELAPALAQLGRDPGQPEAREHVDLAGAGVEQDLVTAPKQALVADLEAPLVGPFAQLDVVALRPGEVVQASAEGLRREQAQVGLLLAVEPDRAAPFAADEDLFDVAEGHEARHDGAGIGRGDENVEIANRGLAPSHAAGELDRRGLGQGLDLGGEPPTDAQSLDQRDFAATLAVGFDTSEDLVDHRRPHPRHGLDGAGLGCVFELIDGLDPEPVVEVANRRWPEALDLNHLAQTRPDLAAELVEIVAAVRPQHLFDPADRPRPDPADLAELAVTEHLLGGPREPLDDPGRATKRRDPVPIAAVDLQQVGHLGEQSRDLRVFEAGHAWALAWVLSCAPDRATSSPVPDLDHAPSNPANPTDDG